MKKLIGIAVATLLFNAPVFAQSIEETQILNSVKNLILSPMIAYKTEPVIEKKGADFTVSVPTGEVKDATKSIVPAFNIQMIEDGRFWDNPQYRFTLDSLYQLNSFYGFMLDKIQGKFATFSFQGQVVPALNEMTSKNVNATDFVLKSGKDDLVKLSSLTLNDNITALSDRKVSQKTKIVARDLSINHFFIDASVKSVTLEGRVPSFTLNPDIQEEVFSAPKIESSWTVENLTATSIFLPVEKLEMDFSSSVVLNQDMTTKNVDMLMTLDVPRIFAPVEEKEIAERLPTYLSMNMKVSGLSYDHWANMLKARVAFNEISQAPFVRPEDVEKMQAQLKEKEKQMIENATFMIEDFKVGNADYWASLKGQIYPSSERFVGTVQIENFDFLSPLPRSINKEQCQKASENWSDIFSKKAGNMNDADVEAAFKAAKEACDSNAGVLQPLRPYLKNAKKTIAADGKEVVEFAVEFKNKMLFIDGQVFNPQSEKENALKEPQVGALIP